MLVDDSVYTKVKRLVLVYCVPSSNHEPHEVFEDVEIAMFHSCPQGNLLVIRKDLKLTYVRLAVLEGWKMELAPDAVSWE